MNTTKSKILKPYEAMCAKIWEDFIDNDIDHLEAKLRVAQGNLLVKTNVAAASIQRLQGKVPHTIFFDEDMPPSTKKPLAANKAR